MSAFLERVKREPALFLSLVGSVMSLLLAFGLPLTDVQQGAVMVVITGIVGFAIRSQVTPNASVAAKEADAKRKADEAAVLVAGEAAPVPEGEPVTVVPSGVVEVMQDAALPDEVDMGPSER